MWRHDDDLLENTRRPHRRHQVSDFWVRICHCRIKYADGNSHGKDIEDAKTITNKDVAAALEGLPKNKLHCSNLGADALQLAIKDYEDRKAGVTRAEPKRKDEHEHTHGDKCYCPYCDIELDMEATFCDACQSSLEEEH